MICLADVYDLRHLENPPDFRYFLDTNILKFVFARTPVGERAYQTEHYPAFFKTLKRNRRPCFTLVENILELMGVLDSVEKTLRNLNSIKEYRRDQLRTYLDFRRGIYTEVDQSVDILQAAIPPKEIEAYFAIDFSIDINDYIYVKIANNPGVAFVSDDSEFMQIAGLNLFSANETVVQAAQRCKKLKSR